MLEVQVFNTKDEHSGKQDRKYTHHEGHYWQKVMMEPKVRFDELLNRLYVAFIPKHCDIAIHIPKL